MRRETSAHKSKHLNEWTAAQIDAACKKFWDSRQPGYPGGPVSDPVFMQQFFVHVGHVNWITMHKIKNLLFLFQKSIRQVARNYPKIGYTTLQGHLSGRVKGYDHASGGKGKERMLPPDTEGKENQIIFYFIYCPLM